MHQGATEDHGELEFVVEGETHTVREKNTNDCVSVCYAGPDDMIMVTTQEGNTKTQETLSQPELTALAYTVIIMLLTIKDKLT